MYDMRVAAQLNNNKECQIEDDEERLVWMYTKDELERVKRLLSMKDKALIQLKTAYRKLQETLQDKEKSLQLAIEMIRQSETDNVMRLKKEFVDRFIAELVQRVQIAEKLANERLEELEKLKLTNKFLRYQEQEIELQECYKEIRRLQQQNTLAGSPKLLNRHPKSNQNVKIGLVSERNSGERIKEASATNSAIYNNKIDRKCDTLPQYYMQQTSAIPGGIRITGYGVSKRKPRRESFVEKTRKQLFEAEAYKKLRLAQLEEECELQENAHLRAARKLREPSNQLEHDTFNVSDSLSQLLTKETESSADLNILRRGSKRQGFLLAIPQIVSEGGDYRCELQTSILIQNDRLQGFLYEVPGVHRSAKFDSSLNPTVGSQMTIDYKVHPQGFLFEIPLLRSAITPLNIKPSVKPLLCDTFCQGFLYEIPKMGRMLAINANTCSASTCSRAIFDTYQQGFLIDIPPIQSKRPLVTLVNAQHSDLYLDKCFKQGFLIDIPSIGERDAMLSRTHEKSNHLDEEKSSKEDLSIGNEDENLSSDSPKTELSCPSGNLSEECRQGFLIDLVSNKDKASKAVGVIQTSISPLCNEYKQGFLFGMPSVLMSTTSRPSKIHVTALSEYHHQGFLFTLPAIGERIKVSQTSKCDGVIVLTDMQSQYEESLYCQSADFMESNESDPDEANSVEVRIEIGTETQQGFLYVVPLLRINRPDNDSLAQIIDKLPLKLEISQGFQYNIPSLKGAKYSNSMDQVDPMTYLTGDFGLSIDNNYIVDEQASNLNETHVDQLLTYNDDDASSQCLTSSRDEEEVWEINGDAALENIMQAEPTQKQQHTELEAIQAQGFLFDVPPLKIA